MADAGKRPVLRLKGQEIVPPEEDRRVEIGVYDLLLPCRKYEITYRVAILGKVSPSLEFLLRLLKAVPGLTEAEAATFFGYTRAEIVYALNEALAPGYAERKDGRLWLAPAGQALFKDDSDAPAIFSVEERRRAIGFDLLAIAPQPPKSIDLLEQALPELPIEDGPGTGRVTERIGARFARFFHELVERADREQLQRRDLYSIDHVVAKDRFPAPVRVRVFAQASTPSLPEIDLSSWRPDHEVADRPQVENSAAKLVEDLRVTVNEVSAVKGYEALTLFAPEFLKDFITRNGLAVARYWREAVARAGEPRIDRPTIPIAGPFYMESNAKRLLEVLEYGSRDQTEPPDFILSVAPQSRLWGATTLHRDTLSLFKRKMGRQPSDSADITSVCLSSGKPPRYVEKTFDERHWADAPEFPPALEILLVPGAAVAAVTHAPIGAASGQPVALGFASFDRKVLARVQSYIVDRLGRYVRDDEPFDRYLKAMIAPL